LSRSDKPGRPYYSEAIINPGTPDFRSAKTQHKEAIMFTANLNENSIGKKKQKRVLFIIVAATVALILGAVAPQGWAQEISFADAEIFFELNNTDGDLGIHALIDGEPWKRLEIEDPNERSMLNIFLQGRLRRQGLTELFFESAEPTFDELKPEQFFRRFPEGEYEIEGITLDGQELESVAELTHLLPAPAENIKVNGTLVPEDCDAGPVPGVSGPFTISWDPVTLSHPELGRTEEPIEVDRYQVVVEREEPPLKFTVDLPPSVMSLTLTSGLLSSGDEVKLEILVREESGNQTAVESCFEVN
jgi:hypothetical protein